MNIPLLHIEIVYEKLGGNTMFRVSVIVVVTMFIVFGFQLIGAGMVKADELTTYAKSSENTDIDQQYADLATLYAPIRFADGEHVPNQDYLDVLEDKALVLKEHPNLRIVIEGHNSVEEQNTLSAARCVFIHDYLLQVGVKPEQIVDIVNYGSDYPVYEPGFETPDRHELCRRVNFIVIGSY